MQRYHKKKILSCFVLVALYYVFVPTLLFAALVPAGVQNGHVWFSKESFFAGETITVSVLLFNSTASVLSGTIELRDGTTTLATKPFSVSSSGGSLVVTFPWLVTPGEHSMSAVITQSALSDEKGGAVSASSTLAVTATSPEKRFAELDVNKNGIADSKEPPPPVEQKMTVATSSKDLNGPTKITGYLPKPLEAIALPVTNKIELFREGESRRAEAHIAELRSTLSMEKDGADIGFLQTITDVARSGAIFKTPFGYVKLFFELLWHVVVAHPVVFYGLIILVILKAIQMIYRFFFS